MKKKGTRTVLISGGSTRVIICEIEGHFQLANFSFAVDKFYTLPKPKDDTCYFKYLNALKNIIEEEKVSYYIPVNATNEAFYDALAKTQLKLNNNCFVFVPTVKEVLLLDDFYQVLKTCRNIGLNTPSYHYITSFHDIKKLYDSGIFETGYYFMINVGRSGIGQRIEIEIPKYLKDFNFSHEISTRMPWMIVQNIKGDRYITCTTIKNAVVEGNVICREGKNDDDLIPIDNKEINDWIQTFFNKIEFRTICGHFTFRFVIPHSTNSVIPLDCRVGVSLPYICFTSVHSRILWKPCKHFSKKNSSRLLVEKPRYWISDAILSILNRLSMETLMKFFKTILNKQEAVFVYWDPIPCCAYNFLQKPFKKIFDFIEVLGNIN
ncbi:conserved hypothetical protein [Pediculus humanus corporis]|uniref:Uncharacterized protein n=1 Tax=Pediculus humanus subsp. corporis TaxID=121224 RepID=E0VQE9_PEDHC|nr:uncharacterized protein Phum_PHUM376820 [Pediculus humanus corporis]EEB15605.1 conserved hypothetical protein [Pediculus humanus corporis]